MVHSLIRARGTIDSKLAGVASGQMPPAFINTAEIPCFEMIVTGSSYISLCREIAPMYAPIIQN